MKEISKMRDDQVINIEKKKTEVESWFKKLRDEICFNFELLENSYSQNQNSKPIKFESKNWKRKGGGGGKMSIMHGNLFEKVGVNISTVHGTLSEEFRLSIPGTKENGKFWASGISVVSHPRSPHVPAAHMNTRFIVTSESWFGGGGDITPMVPAKMMSEKFHSAFKKTCDSHDESYYKKYKKWADEYFFIKHRDEPRGDGGIFFDYMNNNWSKDFSFVRDVGATFLEVYKYIIKQTMDKVWDEADRKKQLIKRGRYAEFNLVYDRGTLFGLKTGGNIDAILMSLPPEVKWP